MIHAATADFDKIHGDGVAEDHQVARTLVLRDSLVLVDVALPLRRRLGIHASGHLVDAGLLACLALALLDLAGRVVHRGLQSGQAIAPAPACAHGTSPPARAISATNSGSGSGRNHIQIAMDDDLDTPGAVAAIDEAAVPEVETKAKQHVRVLEPGEIAALQQFLAEAEQLPTDKPAPARMTTHG